MIQSSIECCLLVDQVNQSEVISKTRRFFVKRGRSQLLWGLSQKAPIFIWNPPAFFKSPLYLKMTRTFQKFASKWFCFSFQHGKIYMVLLNNETKSFVVQARSPKHEKCKRFTSNFKIWKVFSTIPKHDNAMKMLELIMSSRKHHRSDVNDELNVLRWVARMDEQLEKPKMTRHGRRHKSV